jgi:hypothetical protein
LLELRPGNVVEPHRRTHVLSGNLPKGEAGQDGDLPHILRIRRGLGAMHRAARAAREPAVALLTTPFVKGANKAVKTLDGRGM